MFRTMTHVAQTAVRQAFDTLRGNKLLKTVNIVGLLRKAKCKLYFCSGKHEKNYKNIRSL